MKKIAFVVSLITALSFSVFADDAKVYDIVIYGGSPAAVSAAVQAKRMGKSAVIVLPDVRIGGLTTGGLGQTDIGNKHAPTTIIAPITSKFAKKALPTHIELTGLDNLRDSVVLCEQIKVIDKQRLSTYMCEVPPEIMALVDEAIKISLGLA